LHNRNHELQEQNCPFHTAHTPLLWYYPSYFKFQVRWLHSFALVTYLCTLLRIHSFAAFLQLELFRVQEHFSPDLPFRCLSPEVCWLCFEVLRSLGTAGTTRRPGLKKEPVIAELQHIKPTDRMISNHHCT